MIPSSEFDRHYDAPVRDLIGSIEQIQDLLDEGLGDDELLVILGSVDRLLQHEVMVYAGRPTDRSGQVYFIQAGEDGPIKIGYSATPKARLRHLQTANPRELRLLATVAAEPFVESAMHVDLDEHRLHGEWFSPDAAVFAAMNKLVESRAS